MEADALLLGRRTYEGLLFKDGAEKTPLRLVEAK
jgi:hypothetical protein